MAPSAADLARDTRVDQDLQSHARTLGVFTQEIADLKQKLAILEVENKHQDEKLNSILGLGRTVLITVITLAVGLGFAYLASGGFIVPKV